LKLSATAIIRAAEETLSIEAASILALKGRLGKDFSETAQRILRSQGRVVVTGIGKSAIIANKVVATLNSTGTSSMFMHAADAIHGDLGMIREEDIIVCISKSGESPEIKILVPLVRNNGNLLVAIVGNLESYLATNADLVLDTTVTKEACRITWLPQQVQQHKWQWAMPWLFACLRCADLRTRTSPSFTLAVHLVKNST
jgi:arabinose-5-phosphate isomerase